MAIYFDWTQVAGNIDPQPVTQTYTVTFVDYDNTILKEKQQVKINQDAIPPSDPVRDGYKFTGYNPDFHNVQSDLTCVAQYVKETKRYENPRYVSSINRDTTLFKYQ